MFTLLIFVLKSVSFHMFVSSSIYFISFLEFSKCRSFTSLGRIIPRHFILFDAMVNETVSLISLSDLSLLLYRNVRDFCVLIYHTTLSNSLISINSFLAASLGFSMDSICKQWQFYFLFSNLDSFYFLFFSNNCG